MSPASLLFLLLLGALWSFPLCLAQLYYVNPADSTNTSCPTGEPCYTLNYYAQHAQALLSGRGNVTLLFLDGVHVLNEQRLIVSNTTNLLFSGAAYSVSHQPVVMLTVGWDLSNVDTLQIHGLNVNASDLSVCGKNNALTINAMHVQSYTHLNMSVNCCNFNVKMIREMVFEHSKYNHSFFAELNYNEDTDLVLSISHCVFVHGYYISDGYSININLNNGNMNVNASFQGSITNSDLPSVKVNVQNDYMLSIDIENSTNITCDIVFSQPLSQIEIRLESTLIDFVSINNENILTQSNGIFQMNNCTVNPSGHLGPGFISNVSISESCFQEDSGLRVQFASVLDLTNVTFLRAGFSITSFIPTHYIIQINNCLFESLSANFSAVQFSNAEVTFYGETVFRNNRGYRGGAIYLFNSLMRLTNGSRLIFENNTAEDKGGAVYVDNPCKESYLNPQCMYILAYDVRDKDELNSMVVFKDNTALNGGSNIYGTSLKSFCPVSSGELSYEVQSDIFNFDNKSSPDLSSVSSDPTRVCLCENGTPVCANLSYIIQHRRYSPGENFTVEMALVGGDFGTVPGSVHTVLLSEQNERLPIDDNQAVRVLPSTNCSSVEYTFHSDNESGLIHWFLFSDLGLTYFLTHNLASTYSLNSSIVDYYDDGLILGILSNTPVMLIITIQPCPLGFSLKTGSCACGQELLDVSVRKCFIINGEGRVNRSGTIWVSHAGGDNNKSDGVLAYNYCPHSYCKAEEVTVNLFHPDIQCAFNHSGTLCGGCPSGLSLALGSSRCLHCADNAHIALLLPFVVAGIVLVLLIKLLDFTVTKGAINGLILYANILWANKSVFFPYDQQFSVVLNVFATFIAWLNLDFGIETCFIKGLDMYWKTWLQFLFPLYIWSLAGLIILACRYSDKATKLFGNCTVHILATMFLLSYTKLLRTIITTLEFAVLKYPDGNRVIWLADGNLLYFGLRHSFLFIAAMTVLIVFWLPYTLALFLVPWFRKYCSFRWVNKLKPFFDAHYGPLKDKHQYWIGLTLLVRVVLAVSGVAIQDVDPTVNILLTAILSSLLIYIAGRFVYRSMYVSLLEASFILNLIILCCVFLYTRDLTDRSTLTCVSVGIGFLTFVIMFTVQVYTRIKATCVCTSRKQRDYENIDGANDSMPISDTKEPTRSVVSINDRPTTNYVALREALLESD